MNGNKIGVDPKLGDLTNSGGVTQTFSLLSGSPAIDAGDNPTCAADPINNLDQRGMTRPRDGDGNGSAICDMGAYEAATLNTATPTQTRTLTPTQTNTPTLTGSPTRANTPTATGTVCATKPAEPKLTKPKKNATVTKSKVTLKWRVAACVIQYKVSVKNVATNKTVFKATVTVAQAKTKALPDGSYKWFVTAVNGVGKTKSAVFPFAK